MRRILSVLLENESGALSRVIGLFSQRGYNIESLTVAPTDDPTLSRMTIQTVGDEKVLEQIEKQLHKLVDVLRVSELGQGAHVERHPACDSLKYPDSPSARRWPSHRSAKSRGARRQTGREWGSRRVPWSKRSHLCTDRCTAPRSRRPRRRRACS